MTNQDILRIALQQSAYDCNCRPEDFLKSENVITIICAISCASGAQFIDTISPS